MTDINLSSQVYLVNIKNIYYNYLLFINFILTKDQETADMVYQIQSILSVVSMDGYSEKKSFKTGRFLYRGYNICETIVSPTLIVYGLQFE